MSHHPLGWVPPQVTATCPTLCWGPLQWGGATHIHVVLQNLRSGLILLGKAQLELDGLGDGVHIWDLTARLTQEPPHGGELGQGDPVWGRQTHTC